MSGRGREWRIRGALLLGALGLALGAAEALVRGLEPAADAHSLHRTLPGEPYLYGLDPAHPEVSRQGLRDGVFAIPRPEGVRRVLLLGDSIVYGVGVERDETLSRQLERRLRAAGENVEVINAGVHGWSPWNERHFYVAHGRDFGADTVVAVFCLNDVADPFLHWRYSRGVVPTIPAEAVPNLGYHVTHSVALLEAQRRTQQARQRFPLRVLRRSALFRRLSEALAPRPERPVRRVDGREWPLELTGEDSIAIDVLMDPTSPEWRWLRAQYRALRDAVAADGAELVIASVPLAYQLDPDYPYVPQTHLARMSAALGLRYLPALPALRGLPVGEIFRGHTADYDDIWHLTPAGLDRVAAVLAAGLASEPAASAASPPGPRRARRAAPRGSPPSGR